MARHIVEELADQPRCWAMAQNVATTNASRFPTVGERVAVVGCGTSWFMAMSYAALREAAGQGLTDAFAGSEMPSSRSYDRLVVITRSGTTTEIIDVLRSHPDTRTLAITADPDAPVAAMVSESIVLDFADERSVVQTRFATTALALLRASLGEDLTQVVRDSHVALALELGDLLELEQMTFLGRGWVVGLAHEAALKLREAAQFWAEAYPALDYRHGPIAIAEPRRAVWSLDRSPAALASDIQRTGAKLISYELDPMATLVAVQRLAVELAGVRGLDPDQPRHLTRSVVLGQEAV